MFIRLQNSPYFSVSFGLKSNRKGSGTSMKITTGTGERLPLIRASHIPTSRIDVSRTERQKKETVLQSICSPVQKAYKSHCLPFQGEKDVASWVRAGVVGQPSYDAATKEIVATKKNTSDVTSQVVTDHYRQSTSCVTCIFEI